ncbi:long-chain fatty acid--CoA ligase [Benzoatithermus flavus]|uniref:Long-chain fatty acid--CoA ligase n=1 Tax=Benzoatithermus flavus TaxID=3108223 RepID=A0ABU8XLY1_9PROT
MRGLMMEVPLLVSSLIEHGGTVHHDQEVVSRSVEGPIHRATWAQIRERSKRLARALGAILGLEPFDRVATLAWNGFRHLELYYGISGSGRVCHVLNPRLAPDQLVHIVDHAADRALFVDLDLLPIVEPLLGRLETVRSVVVMTDRTHMPETKLSGVHCYEELITACPADDYRWPELDENDAAGLCYTSGTTGEPKGVLYSHRSTVLHAMTIGLSDYFDLGAGRAVLPAVPMFHVMAWGIPHAAALTGAKLVLPGPRLDGDSLFALVEQEQIEFACGVPTVWHGLLTTMRHHGRAPVGLRRVLVGGSAPPLSMVEAFEREFGVEVRQGWGMTETSPVGCVNTPKPALRDLSEAERLRRKTWQGMPIFGVRLEVVDEEGRPVPHDGITNGRLLAQGPWVCSGYYRRENRAVRDGWLDTGDIATMDADGCVHIVDRAKDLIKSGGEWISSIASIAVENVAASCPGIAMAAVIAVPDERWGERPLLIAVPATGVVPDRDRVLVFLGECLPKWQVPDDVVFVDALPIGGTGKVLKARLRAQYRDHRRSG